MENFASVSIMTGNAIQVIICWNTSGKHNILKHSRFIMHVLLPSGFLWFHAFALAQTSSTSTLKGKGRRTWQAFQQLVSGMLNFPVSTLLFFLASLFLWPFLCKMLSRHACVIVPSPIPLFLPLSTFYLIYLPPA